MSSDRNLKERNTLYDYGYSKLFNPSKENVNILVNHLFHLKVNDDYVINSEEQVEELVTYINDNE